jgi:hypothetical protein
MALSVKPVWVWIDTLVSSINNLENAMPTRQLFIIDPSISDYESLISSLPECSEWVLLDDASDGVMQLQDILANYHDLDSIQIVSQGKPGALQLGSRVVNNDNLQSYASALPAISASLAQAGDLLWHRRTGRSRRAATAARPGVQPSRRQGTRQAALPA